MQHDAADQLHVEVPHVEEAASGFAHRGEGGNQQVVERGALRQLLAKCHGLPGELFVAQGLHLRFQLTDGRDGRQQAFTSRSCLVPNTFARKVSGPI